MRNDQRRKNFCFVLFFFLLYYFLNCRSVWNYVHYFRRKVAAFKKNKISSFCPPHRNFPIFIGIFGLSNSILLFGLFFISIFFSCLPVHQHFKCLPCICVARIAPNKNVWIKWYLWTMFFFDEFVHAIALLRSGPISAAAVFLTKLIFHRCNTNSSALFNRANSELSISAPSTRRISKLCLAVLLNQGEKICC